MDRRLLNIKEAAVYLRISVGTLYHWICRRKIDYIKQGRKIWFDREDIDKWVRNHRVKAV